MAAISLNPIIWGATRTTTFTTSATATPGEVVYFNFPVLTTSQTLEYTILPSPTSPNSKQFPNGQPILVLTQVDGVIINPQGQTLSTATVVQAPPPLFPTLPPGDKLTLVPPSYKWETWTTGEKAGVVVAAVLAFFGLIVALWYVCGLRRKRKKVEKDMEKGPTGGGNGKGKKGKNKAASVRSVRTRDGPRGIEGMDNVEMGPAARRSVLGDPSSAPAQRGRGSRRSQREGGNRESEQQPGVNELAGQTRRGEMPVVPVGQRPLRPPVAGPSTRAEMRQSERDGHAGPSRRGGRTEAREADSTPHNPLADDDDNEGNGDRVGNRVCD